MSDPVETQIGETLEAINLLRDLLMDPHPGLHSWQDAANNAATEVERLLAEARFIVTSFHGNPRMSPEMNELMMSDSIKDKMSVLGVTGATMSIQKFNSEGKEIGAAVFLNGETIVKQALELLKSNMPGEWV